MKERSFEETLFNGFSTSEFSSGAVGADPRIRKHIGYSILLQFRSIYVKIQLPTVVRLVSASNGHSLHLNFARDVLSKVSSVVYLQWWRECLLAGFRYYCLLSGHSWKVFHPFLFQEFYQSYSGIRTSLLLPFTQTIHQHLVHSLWA